MTSGSLKDLTKALHATIPTASVPLPDDVLDVIQAYLEKHPERDGSDSQRLQDELTTLFQNHVLENPPRLAPFLAILRTLKPAIRGSGRLSQWWEKLSPALNKLGEERGLAEESKNALLDILVYDDEEEDEDSVATSAAVSENLVDVWLQKHILAMDDFDDEAEFIEAQIKGILLAFGKKKPKAFLTVIDKFFVRKESRILILGLLCEFIRHQPPHLHQLLQTPLFGNLLKCLQIDTSTRAISLAMTALIMFLPHIPSSLADHLPALFNIYSRMLFWDRERRALSEPLLGADDNEKNEKAAPATGDWDKLSYLLESDDENVPELMHFFTFLYGLYPLNFMSYIRKPQKYLRHAKFAGADDLDVEPTEMRQRSEAFRQVHLLHPNFYEMTIEDELTSNNRWMKSEAADVVTECMALYNPGEESHLHASRSRPNQVDHIADIPDQPLLDDMTPYQSRHTSWRNTQSTAVASPDPCINSGLQQKLSQTSQSMHSIADSPSLRPSDRLQDSPTLPPHILSSPHQLQDMLNSAKSTRGSMYQSLTNDSVASLADSHSVNSGFQVDAYLQSLTRDHPVARSPSLRPTNANPSLRVAYLHREIQLLHNDLNFERYLKQQHLSHIGQLRRKQIREARVEAETQNLVNSNRGLKSKLEDAKKSLLQMKKETEKSKSHSRKWEADLTTKLRILREEQKKWIKERDNLNTQLEKASDDNAKLLELVVSAEAKELSSQQKMQSIDSSLDELERLEAEVDKLTISLRTYEAREGEAAQEKARVEATLKEVEILKMQLRARDEELLKSASAFENELRDARREEAEALNGKKPAIQQEVIDCALAVSRKRIVEISKKHNRLMKMYNELYRAYMDLSEHATDDTPHVRLRADRSPSPFIGNQRNHADADYDSPSPPAFGRIETWDGRDHSPTEPRIAAGSLDGHLAGLDAIGNTAQGAAAYHYGPAGRESIGNDVHSLDANGRPKIKPQSDLRVYGRGGVQNIGKTAKDKKDKGKGKDDPSTPDGTGSLRKKDKKPSGFPSIRGLI